MDLYVKDDSKVEKGEDVANALIQLIEQNLDLKNWKFQVTFKKCDQTSNIKIIYDSKWCRVKFMFSRQRIPQYDELSVEYGRIHAPNEQPFMEWQDQQCHCWHHVMAPLRFLDGLTPYDAMQQSKVQKRSPAVVESFMKSETGKKLFDEYPPIAQIQMHSILWQHYGQRLFELFDLRRPELWENYRSFIKEYYRLIGIKISYGPPYENIC